MQLQQPFAIAYGSVTGFLYQSPISINAAQVPSTQTDFPVLVSQTDNRFKTVANGGHVQNANGYDIRPYSDSGITTAITGYELERYDATTGEVVMWVKVGSLSSSTTPIYLAYGNAGINTDGSGTTTWSNSFTAVYHLKDGTTLSVTDSLGTHNGTNNNGVTATAGQIDGAAGFASASSQYVSWASGTLSPAMTFTCWVKATTFPNSYNCAMGWCNGVDAWFILRVKSNGKLACYYTASGGHSYDGTGSHTLSTGTWYHLSMTYNSSAGLVGYVNAASDNTVAAAGTLDAGTSPFPTISLGQLLGIVVTEYWNGVIDEGRISSVARSADWITTEYNNQSAPATFETLGTEVAL